MSEPRFASQQYRRMKLLLVVNKDAWAIGTLARFLALGAPEHWDVTIATLWDAERYPEAFREQVSGADIVHWMLHRTVLEPPAWNSDALNVCSVHHIEDYENSFDYLTRCQGIVVHAERYRQLLLSKGIPEAALVCIPQPVDDAFLATGAWSLSHPKSRRLDSPFRIGFFSTAEYGLERKGIDLLPDVLGPLTASGRRYTLLVTGFKWPELLRERSFGRLPVTLTMAPSYFDMPRLYSSLDVYLCLSRIEGGPMPVFEAAACGVPVISTAVGRVPELLRANYSYVDIPIGDAGAASRALRVSLEEPEEHRQYARRAYNAVAASLMVDRYQRLQFDFYSRLSGIPWTRSSTTAHAIKGKRTRWRAADRLYWAKELWTRGNRLRALRLATEALCLDPFSPVFWRAIGRRIGVRL